MKKLSDLTTDEKKQILKEGNSYLIKKEYKSIYSNIFQTVDEWRVIEKFRSHRSKLTSIENIEIVKTRLHTVLGDSAVYYFLNRFKAVDYPGEYNNVESMLLLLYQMVEGHSQDESLIPKSSFGDIYRMFWYLKKTKKHFNIHDENTNLKTMMNENNSIMAQFSSIKSRVLFANLNNPEEFKSCTVHIDGFDDRIEYNSKKDVQKYKTGAFYGYKFKKNGIRTNVADDINGFTIQITKSERVPRK
jgi:hypothetical protein